MISRRYRFHGHNSLKYVYSHGQTVRGPLSSLKYATNARRTNHRLAVVVSKKVSKSAVKRNRIRRRLYEAFRAYETDMTEPYDLVVTVFSDQVAELDTPALQRLLKAQLRQAGIIAKRPPKST